MDLITLADVQIGGEGFINQLLQFLVIGICVAIVYAMGYWFATRPSISAKAPIFLTIWNGVFVLIGGIALVNFLLGLFGHGFIRW